MGGIEAASAQPVTPGPPSWWRRIAHWLGIALTVILLFAGLGVWAIDTTPGHRFLADRIAQYRPSSGLRIRVGRIDGSLWSRMELRDLRLFDDHGLFLEVPELTLDWRPTAWMANRLQIRRIETDLAVLYRLPALRPGPARKGPILPGFDVRVDRLSVRRLQAEPLVSGARRFARIEARGDVRHGRALIDIGAGSNARDSLRVKLDAEPDRDGFMLRSHIVAPHGGLIGAMLGISRSFLFDIDGAGRWSGWSGHARMDMEQRRVIDLSLSASDGDYALKGILAPSPYLQGKLQRLSAPVVAVSGKATLADRKLLGSLGLVSPALMSRATGTIDLATGSFARTAIDMTLRRPAALFPNMSGSDVSLHVLLDGPFAGASFDYALTSRHVAFDQTGFDTVRAVGKGHLSRSPVIVPIRLSATQVTGVGQVAGGILRNLTIDGDLKVTPKRLTGDSLGFTSDRLKGRLVLAVDLVTGHYDVNLSGTLGRYLIPGLGIVDVRTELKVLPAEGGHGTQVVGRGHAWVRRFDNAFLRSLADGLPEIETGLQRGPDGILHFTGLKLTAPGISVTGEGLRRRDGTFQFSGSGRQATYGMFRMVLDGDIARPRLDLAFDRPNQAMGLDQVHLLLDPEPSGFAWRATGGSRLGPFSGDGRILLPSGQPATIAVARLDVTGTRGTGSLRSDPGGFTGTLALAGGGIDGQILFAPVGAVQRIEPHLRLGRATLGGDAAASVRRATIDGALVLDPQSLNVDGTVVAVGFRRGGVLLGRAAVKASLKGGSGKVSGVIAGSRGRLFNVSFASDIAPDRIALSGSGTLDQTPIALTGPAVLTRDGDGWRLAPTGLGFGGGTASLAGQFGGSVTEVDASLDRMPLGVFNIMAPNLGLGGVASGHFTYRLPKGGQIPVGRADLRIRGLTRSGLVLVSRPVDLGLNVVLSPEMALGRAVAVSEGKEIGRAQTRIGPLAPTGMIGDRLLRAPLFAQMRYNGPADTLWRLTGLNNIDLSGPVAIAADVGGLVDNPTIRGSLRADGARLESAVTGTVIEQVRATGRFGGSKLTIDTFAGVAKGGGAVNGHGSFDLAAANGFGMDLAFTADHAQVLNRDDIAATITGPIAIQSDGSGGSITGNVRIDKGRFRLGRASMSTIPQLDITEINRPADEIVDAAPRKPWRLDIKADAANQLAVSGLGLDSEWRAKLAIAGTADNPAISGRADLVRGGYQFAGKRFDLDRGVIRFTGDTPPDPVLDIQASANVQGLSATIRVSGTGQKPQINFASVPAMPEDELLSRLLFGDSITNLSAPEALQLAAAVASLRGGGGGLDPINAVRRAIGLDRLRVLPADATTKQGTSVAAGKYIGRRTYVELITDGQGYSATSIEFQITRWLSLLSTISTVGRQNANVRISKDY